MPKKEFVVNQKRDFGSIISDAFVFLKRTYKIQFEFFLILVVPILLLAIYNYYYLFESMDFEGIESSNSPFGQFSPAKLILSYGGTILAYLMFSYIIYAVLIKYEEGNNITPNRNEISDFLKSNAGKYVSYFLTVIFIFLLLGLIGFGMIMISPGFGVLLIFLMMIAIFYIVPYISIFPILYLKEGKGFAESLSNTLRLIKGQWWPTFGVIIVTNIIASFATYILIIPIYIMMMVNIFSSADDPSGGDQIGFWMSLLLIASLVSGIIVLTYSTSAIGLKYYDLKERIDNVGLIDKIDNIGNNETSFFENEGEY